MTPPLAGEASRESSDDHVVELGQQRREVDAGLLAKLSFLRIALQAGL